MTRRLCRYTSTWKLGLYICLFLGPINPQTLLWRPRVQYGSRDQRWEDPLLALRSITRTSTLLLWLWRKWRNLALMRCHRWEEWLASWDGRWSKDDESGGHGGGARRLHHLLTWWASHWSWTMGDCRNTSSAPTVGPRPPGRPESLTPEHLKLLGENPFFPSGTFPTSNHGPAVRCLWLLRWSCTEITVSWTAHSSFHREGPKRPCKMKPNTKLHKYLKFTVLQMETEL